MTDSMVPSKQDLKERNLALDTENGNLEERIVRLEAEREEMREACEAFVDAYKENANRGNAHAYSLVKAYHKAKAALGHD